MTENERVLVFPAEELEPYLHFFKNGICTDGSVIGTLLNNVTDPAIAVYMDRQAAEADPNFKQIIPYSVLWHTGQVFIYQRTKKAGESRLHDKWSLGVGGHINQCDGISKEAYRAAHARELNEEVSLDCKLESSPAACIYDPSDDVGRVHFGFVHLINVPDPSTLQFHDLSLANGRFVSMEELEDYVDKFENWSKLVYQHVILED